MIHEKDPLWLLSLLILSVLLPKCSTLYWTHSLGYNALVWICWVQFWNGLSNRIHSFFSERLNEEELRCVHSGKKRFLENRWNCWEYNPTLRHRSPCYLTQRSRGGGCVRVYQRFVSGTDATLGCGSGSGPVRGPRVRHGPGIGLPQHRSSSLLAAAHVAVPSPTFILRIPQQTRSLWVTEQSGGGFFRDI